METVIKIHGAPPVLEMAACVGVPGGDGWVQGPRLLVGSGVLQLWRKLQHEVAGHGGLPKLLR